MTNHYDILEIESSATEAEIKKAFRSLAVKYHPDKHMGDNFFVQKFIEVKEAYDVLIDADSRKSYDFNLKQYQYRKVQEKQNPQKTQAQDAPDESSYYEPYRPFYSSKDREQQETPKTYPKYDLWGEALSGGWEFFRFPENIGKIIGAYSDLKEGEQPITFMQRAFYVLKRLGIGFLIGLLILFIANPSWVLAILGFAVPLAIAIISMKPIKRFEHANYFVAVNGFAEYKCKGQRSQITAYKEVNFNEITDVYLYQVEMMLNSKYQYTEYFYFFFHNESGQHIYVKKGRFNKKKPKKIPLDFQFCQKAEHYWTVYLLDNLEKKLEEDGHLLFNLYDLEKKTITPYIQLSLGQITFLRNGIPVFTYQFDEIKRIYAKGNDLFIEHTNFHKTMFFFKSGNADKIPVLNLCNRPFFYNAMELLLGYSLY
ncbi:J domain-containing protein [Ascidiimonas sp. W6]|uniref:J domain-containing protein n=1 Tax=Ascidiimonas meishanensis TaxID=3128903 RepID=UPI0030EDFA0F